MTDEDKKSQSDEKPGQKTGDSPDKEKKKGRRMLEDGNLRGIGRAIVLPWSTAISIAVNSMKQRFWRSIITTTLIVMAISFMMYMSGQSAVMFEMKGLFDKHDREFKKLKNPTAQQRKDYEPWKELGIKLDNKGMSGSDETERVAQTNWLMFLAALVALVGISNAMLMSVTERFREIGTMKCLGALDTFIIKLFFLESMFQGITGTIMGIIIGIVLMVLYVFLSLGGIVWEYFPVMNVLSWVVKSFFIGTAISMVAAILPAWRAAIMQPVDALRSEV